VTKLDYIFLDLDGPILEGKLRHYNCYKDIILVDGGTPLEINDYWEMKRNKIRRDIVLEKSQYKNSYAKFIQRWNYQIEHRKYLLFDILKPEVKEVLISWRSIANNIVLVTMRNNRNNLLWQLKKLDIFSCLDQVIACPNIDGNGSKYSKLKDISFERAIFVGDTEEDTITAAKLGIKSIAITNGLRTKEHLDADYYFDEIKDIDFHKIIPLL